MNDFEYDDDKSSANQEKHGIDFLMAQALWNAPRFAGNPSKIGR